MSNLSEIETNDDPLTQALSSEENNKALAVMLITLNPFYPGRDSEIS